jgi:hypothetical protein
VVYRDVLGLSYRETAEQMGTSVNAVTMLLHRGRRGLRRTLGVTAGGIGLWRWLKRAGLPQVAVAKGAAATVVVAGLATTGVVVARAIAPAAADTAVAAPATRFGDPAGEAGRTHREILGREPDRRRPVMAGGPRASSVPASTRGSGAAETAASVHSAAAGAAPAPSTLRLPTASLPTLQIPTAAQTVTVSTPATAVTVTIPTATAVTVPTPIATVTVPIP